MVDEDEAAVHRDADLVVAEPFGDRTAPDRDEQHFGFDGRSVLQGHRDTRVGTLHTGEPGTQMLFDAAAAQRPLQQLGAGLLLQRDQMWQRLDDRDVSAEGTPYRGELAADRASAENHGGRRYAVERQGVVAGDHLAMVDFQARQ